MASIDKLDPDGLRPSMVDANGNLKPSLVTSSYAGGVPQAGDLKPSLVDAAGNLKPGITCTLDADEVKSSLRGAGYTPGGGGGGLGDEQIVNGDFSNGSTGWTLSGMGIEDGACTTNAIGIATATHNDVTFDSTKTWRASINVTALVAPANLQFNGVTEQVINATGVQSYDIQPGATGLFRVQHANFKSITFDDVSIREVL